MNPKRLRMIAGPNGSGKTTLLNVLAKKFPLGFVLNPDQIESELLSTGRLDFSVWGLHVTQDEIDQFLRTHPLASKSAAFNIHIENNALLAGASILGGYFVAMLADFMRRRWLETGESFTFETVMSSSDKISLLAQARNAGYRTYLYYVCTDSPTINRERVAIRVRQGGHDVPEIKIVERYTRSLALLKDAVLHSSRSFLFDNSEQVYRLIAEFEESRLVRAASVLPEWFIAASPEK